MEHLEPEDTTATEEAAAADAPAREAAVAGEDAGAELAADGGEDAAVEEAGVPAEDAADASGAGEDAGAVAEDGGEAEAEPEAPGVPGMDWYIIHTYSGFENKVKESLRTRSDAFGIGSAVGEILIPTEDVVDVRNGKKVTTKRLLYPGYVLVQLNLDDDLWHVVRNTPRVTGFVGGGQHPVPLTADEVNSILYRQAVSADKPRPKVAYERNDRVKIIDGPFTNFTGTVEDVNEEKSTLKVMVTIFGRGTPVELQYEQVEKEQF